MSRFALRTTKSALATALALLSTGVLGGAACATAEEDPISTPTELDGGRIIGDDDAATGADDAGDGIDGALDSGFDPDAPPRTCSDDGFCHSVVPSGNVLRGVWGDGTGVVWAVSNQGNVLRWDGTTWNVHATGLGALRAIWGSSPTQIFLQGERGIYASTGAASDTLTFALETLPGDPNVPITSMWGNGPNDVWAVGGLFDDSDWPWIFKGRVLHYQGPTTGWVVDDLTTLPRTYTNVWGSAGSGVWIAGQYYDESGGTISLPLLHKAPGATTFSEVTLPEDPKAPSGWGGAQDLSSVGLMGNGFMILRGMSNVGPAAWTGKSQDDGKTFSFTFHRTNAWERDLNAYWGASTTDAWAVGDSGRIEHWDGTAWKPAATRVTNLPVVQSFYGIWATSTTDFWVVGDNLALHKTNGSKP